MDPTQRPHSPLAFVDGEWGQVRWRTRRGSFVTNGTSLKLNDQLKQDDHPVEKVMEDGLYLGLDVRDDFYAYCVENSCQRRDMPLPAEGWPLSGVVGQDPLSDGLTSSVSPG